MGWAGGFESLVHGERKIMAARFLGEFEQMVLLAILQLREDAFALAVLSELDQRVGRSVSRGTLYKTLERLEAKGYLRWTPEDGGPERGGHPRRKFTVTGRGITALRESRDAFQKLWDGLDELVEDS
jgi:DNA-binding PadR family transcriptional regulator